MVTCPSPAAALRAAWSLIQQPSGAASGDCICSSKRATTSLCPCFEANGKASSARLDPAKQNSVAKNSYWDMSAGKDANNMERVPHFNDGHVAMSRCAAQRVAFK